MLELRWSCTQEFHAKGYGFRVTKTAAPTVVLGSANLTGKALGVDSGELGVQLTASTLADAAWAALEDFWEDGKPVTPAWFDWKSFGEVRGYLGRGKVRFLKAIRQLGFKTK